MLSFAERLPNNSLYSVLDEHRHTQNTITRYLSNAHGDGSAASSAALARLYSLQILCWTKPAVRRIKRRRERERKKTRYQAEHIFYLTTTGVWSSRYCSCSIQSMWSFQLQLGVAFYVINRYSQFLFYILKTILKTFTMVLFIFATFQLQ